jgi:hypothetical protein
MVGFYENGTKVADLRLPLDRKFEIWMKPDLDENSKLAVSAVASAILLKIKNDN